MVRDSGRRDEGKSREDGEKNRQRSNATPPNSSRNIRDNNSGVQNLCDKLETATKDIRELEKETYRVKSPPSDALLLAAEIEFFVAYHLDKVQKFKAIQKSLDKRAKTGSRSGSSTDEIEESELLEATKKETIENVQAYDRDTYLAYKKVKNILERKKVQRYKYHNELGYDWFVAAGIPYTLLYG
ncbi:hypothetical protein BPAE_0142g00020 [Botrytis paeoniae]|uniref:Uncharacterized protein n=1 Tax=Botrytis paeoniae TaxID=278948 RepID=A0A4Z1FHX7_9HELO|nr:hypothetical protein BPAE_0142g00020 [Botrytis paeoniae]